MFDIFTIGDIKLDTFVVLNDASIQCELKMPECKLCIDYGAKISVDVVDSQIAGSAPNVAVGLSRMGKKTAVRSPLGNDATKTLAIDFLKQEGVSARYLHFDKKGRSSYSAVLNFKGEKTILTGHIKHRYKLPEKMPKAKWIYVCEMGEGYEGLYTSLLSKKKRNGALLAANPGNIQFAEQKPAFKKLLAHLDVLFLNADEARVLTKLSASDMHHLIAAVYAYGPKLVVMTDGRNGAYSFDGKTFLFAPLFPGKRVEATGAGDSFASGFLGALLQNGAPEDGLAWGSVNAASVVGRVGPTAGLLNKNQIATRLKKHPRYRVKTL